MNEEQLTKIKNELYNYGILLERTGSFIFINNYDSADNEEDEFEININLSKQTIELYADCVSLNPNVSKLLIELFSMLDWDKFNETTTINELKKDFKWQEITLESDGRLYSIYNEEEDDEFVINIKKDTHQIQIVTNQEYVELSCIVSESVVHFFKLLGGIKK